jgi:wyosine [tRNA(Phe)-imidazoG37] synthetase (radical SAM superfamily)
MTRPTPCACTHDCLFCKQENGFDTVKETITLTELGCHVINDKETNDRFDWHWCEAGKL